MHLRKQIQYTILEPNVPLKRGINVTFEAMNPYIDEPMKVYFIIACINEIIYSYMYWGTPETNTYHGYFTHTFLNVKLKPR